MKKRFGFSTMEAIVSITLLASAMVGIGRFAASVQDGLRQRELSSRIDWEILNASDLVRSWPLDEVSAERIESLPFSTALRQQLTGPQWKVEVESEQYPVRALRVTLRLQCTIDQQLASPESFTFWIAPSASSQAPPVRDKAVQDDATQDDAREDNSRQEERKVSISGDLKAPNTSGRGATKE